MRSTRTLRRLALAVALAAAGTIMAVTPSSAQVSPGCTTWDKLTENVISLERHDVAPVGLSVGDYGFYQDEFIDESGALIGTASGTPRMLWERPSNGHIFGSYDDTILIDGSTIRSYGVVDVTKSTTGAYVSIPSLGVSGPYKGWVGVRSWAPQGPGKALAKLTLCHG